MNAAHLSWLDLWCAFGVFILLPSFALCLVIRGIAWFANWLGRRG